MTEEKLSGECENLNEDGTNYAAIDKEGKVYAHGINTVDIIVPRINDGKLEVFLIQRARPPFRHHWVIPGGFVDFNNNESFNDAAVRELREETGITDYPVTQLGTYDEPGRDPRERMVTTVYYSIARKSVVEGTVCQPEDADEVENFGWVDIRDLPEQVGFDHREILTDFVNRLTEKAQYTPLAFDFLDERFTLRELQETYEAILGKYLVAPNFRRKVHAQYDLVPTDEKKASGGRKSVLFRFNGQHSRY